ncbi:MAG: universal stress protein [Puia sp.]|nr:universal stress protein [Puia sp.]
MKTLLIPVDFSPSSDNAVRYAAQLSGAPANKIGRIILLHSYFVSIYEQILPSPDLIQVGEEEVLEKRKQVKDRLARLAREIFADLPPDIAIEQVCSALPLIRAILQQEKDKKPDLLILGSSENGDPAAGNIAAQLIWITKASPVPVLIVPPHTSYAVTNRVLLPCDFRTLSNTDPLKSLAASHDWIKKDLLVLNVDPDLKRAQPDEKFRAVSERLNTWLKEIPHEIYYSDEPDILRGILGFAEEKQVDLVIALPGKHSFFYALTHKSITDALSVNAQKPVLILK